MTLLASSLRLRLILAFSVLVGLILAVGLTSFGINRAVTDQVADLRASDVFDLGSLDLDRVGLEIEGHWNPGGSFVAEDVEVIPAVTRPRLRGAIQALDPDRGVMTLYGLDVHVPEKVEVDGSKGRLDLETLRVGQRVEIVCEVGDGGWEAERIELQGVKDSDKIKGMVTGADLDGEVPETLTMHGLTILVEPTVHGGPESALGRVKDASQMLTALQDCRRSAMELVGAAPSVGAEPDGSDAADALNASVARFAEIIEQAYAEGDDPLTAPAQSYVRLLDSLSHRRRGLESHAANLAREARESRVQATLYLGDQFDPFLQQELIPYVYGYLSRAEEDLGDQLRSVVARTATVTRVALAASVLAVAIAAVLGLLVWRSVHQPIRALHDAALRIGQGHLDTHVHVDSRDEFGVLARSFNRMASEIASTTVSMESLARVFDSMAAALFVCNREGIVTSVNRAGLELVDRSPGELVGQPFDRVCRLEPDEQVGSLSRDDASGSSSERSFRHADGSSIPVSLSEAELRSPAGELQGYVCVAQDLSALKAIERRLRDSLGEKEMLLREVHHRVKNNMQVVCSLLSMHAIECDPTVQRQLDESQNRIRSIALIHEQLYRSEELAHIDPRTYLEDLTAHIAGTFGNPGNVQLVHDVESMDLDLDQSLACGLLVNELVTNAYKHAFPGERAGTIRVSLERTGEDQAALGVTDDGRGMDGEVDEDRISLGMSLLHTLAQQLGGEVSMNGQHGTRIRVIFPLSGRGAA
jgi:PAS domain S-box-containing protein